MLKDVIQALKQVISEVRGGRYKVRRGRINWLKFPFHTYPYGLAILVPEEDDGDSQPLAAKATITLEIICQMPDHSQDEVDDTVLEEFREDARNIAYKLALFKVNDEPICISVDRAVTIEMSDSEAELQGISASMIVAY